MPNFVGVVAALIVLVIAAAIFLSLGQFAPLSGLLGFGYLFIALVIIIVFVLVLIALRG
ncbi:MAG: hypothetical protein ABSG45_08130 [Nitrososphaerales archaeon]